MEMIGHQAIVIQESSQTSAARSEVREVAERAGFDESDAHRAGLVATELATNLVKHANGGGVLLLIRSLEPEPREVELVALDRGPGIADVGRALVDGHSTAGSPGTGLGAIRRMSDDFDIWSTHTGTAVLARVRAKRHPRRRAASFEVGAVNVAKPGETVSGDAWRVRQQVGGAVVLIADGLGHGVLACEASEAAVAAFDREPLGDTVRTLESIHLAIRHTRGAAAAIAEVRKDLGLVRYAGVGNIVTAVCANGSMRQAVSNNGTLGHRAPHFREYSYPWAAESLLVMHSDGLSSRWTLESYPGLKQRDSTLIAAVLYRDFGRSRDDATVLVVKEAA
jgi:anti-sigma regulatory factor (Ser/Thr protein kinase)